MAFQQRFDRPVSASYRKNKPPKLGYNRDRSDDRHYGWPNPWWHYASPAATYNGKFFVLRITCNWNFVLVLMIRGFCSASTGEGDNLRGGKYGVLGGNLLLFVLLAS